LLKFDFPVAAGTVMFTAFIFIIINILVDILYAALDPRIKIKG
jgi:peptide/nickel transport system permease protein